MADTVFDIALEKRFTDSPEVVTINVTSGDTLLLRDAETGSVMKLPFSTLASAISSAFANSFASLVDGKVPASQLPSFVDDVLEYANTSSFPAIGESGKIYVALDSNKTYRWSGSGYTEISASLALGETSSTAYRGDRGKSAYDHSQLTGNPHGTTRSDLGATTVGSNLFTLANPSAIRFLRVNADNTVSPLTDSDFRTAIGAAPTSIVPDRIADDAGCLRVSNPGERQPTSIALRLQVQSRSHFQHRPTIQAQWSASLLISIIMRQALHVEFDAADTITRQEPGLTCLQRKTPRKERH